MSRKGAKGAKDFLAAFHTGDSIMKGVGRKLKLQMLIVVFPIFGLLARAWTLWMEERVKFAGPSGAKTQVRSLMVAVR